MDEGKLRSIKRKVEDNAQELERLVEAIVKKYNRDLHQYMEDIKEKLDENEDKPLSDEVIENMCMKVPVFMYFAATGLETLGVEGDTAKSVKLEIFNDVYLSSKVGEKSTIQDKTSYAELESQSEALVEIAFNRAYKKLKIQIEMAEHVFSGVKKVLSKRLAEMELNRTELGYTPRKKGERMDEKD